MSSSVYFKFKSQKDLSRVTFDGIGISVFDLKRAIINTSKLGDGSDFELILLSEDTNEEYDDDTTIIPRSTTVIARRLPATRPGKGGAARYVSGNAPVTAKNSYRTESKNVPNSRGPAAGSKSNLSETQTEEERIAAVLQMGADQWEQQQQEMANATPVHRGGPGRKPPTNVPDRPPPSGYVCYRCGEKGHWIQVCPTNDDPNWDNRPRIKRTTGIPRSFLKVVEKPTALNNDGTFDELKQPSGVMVNAEGDWVVAQPDQASWDHFQSKAKVAASAKEAMAQGSKQLQDRGLECSIDKRMFVEPTKTPCCQKVYCKDCITNALLDNDLSCPNCGKDQISLEDLHPDKDTIVKIREYNEEKQKPKEIKQSPAGSPKSPVIKEEKGSSVNGVRSSSASKSPVLVKVEKEPTKNGVHYSTGLPENVKSDSSQSPTLESKKRPAESELDNKRQGPGALGKALSIKPTATASPRPHDSKPSTPNPASSTPAIQNHMGNGNIGSMSQFPNNFNPYMNMPPMNTGINPMMGMNQLMMPGMGFGSDMSSWPNMNMPGMDFMNNLNGMNGINGMNNPNMFGGMNPYGNNMMPNFGMNGNGGMGIPPNSNQNNNNNMMNGNSNVYTNGNTNGYMNGANGMSGNHMNGGNGGAGMSNGNMGVNNNQNNNGHNRGGFSNGGNHNFANQQRSNFSNNAASNNEESPYFRQPVNPHRHQARRNHNRPTNYREI
ncbi:hypothetical protein MMC25_004492 [Agyrium rufum]|nr:hypothetical protein [Agyrium rufum]